MGKLFATTVTSARPKEREYRLSLEFTGDAKEPIGFRSSGG